MSRRHFLRRTAAGLVMLGTGGLRAAHAASLGAVSDPLRGAIEKPRPETKPRIVNGHRAPPSSSPSHDPSSNDPSHDPPGQPPQTPSSPPTANSTDLASTVAKDSDLRNHPQVLAYLEFSSVATVTADLARSNWADGGHRAWWAISTIQDSWPRRYAADGTYVVEPGAGKQFCVLDPEFYVDRGLPFMRFSGGDVNNRLIAAHLYAGRGIRHAFCRYVLVIEPDVQPNLTDGVKLPGFEGEYEDTVLHPPHDGKITFSWRMIQDMANAGVDDYLYDGTTGSGYGSHHPYGPKFPIGIPVTIEQELDVDAPQPKGRVWVDGVLVGTRDIVTDIDIEDLFLNIYHGGTRKSKKPIHYRLAAACVATSYIGVPRELRGDSISFTPTRTGDVPRWRSGLGVGRWIELPETSLKSLPVPPGNIDAWCGLAAVDRDSTPVALWVSAAGGGHSDSNDNGVYGIDLLNDAPQWYVMCPPSDKANRVSAAESGAGKAAFPYAHDGKPNSCHTYWSLVWVRQRGRVFRPFSSALWYGAQGAHCMDGFDAVAERWDPAGTWPDCPGAATQALVACDPNTGDIYYGSPNGGISKWTQAANAWAPFKVSGSAFGSPGYHGGVVDAKRNRLVRAGLTSNGDRISEIPFIDLATGKSALASTGISASPIAQRTIVHDSRNDDYYLTDSVNVYKVDPETFAGTSIAPLPVRATNGAHSRFAYFPALGGIAYYPSFANNIWFMATE
jgi:hypothetical protein